MQIYNNTIANRVYVPYLKTLSSLQVSASRLATGEKFASAISGTAELGIADDLRRKIRGTNSLLSGIQDAKGYSQTQDDVLGEVSEIVQRMNELATAALDTTKTASDRSALNSEFLLLDQEIEDTAANSKYNGTNLFGTTSTIRIGLETTDTVTLSRIQLSLLSFSNLSITTTTAAQSAVSRIAERLASLNLMRAQSRAHAGRMERTLSFTQSYVTNLGETEAAIRNVDLAQETGEFTRKQVVVSSAQAVLAQANRLSQTAQTFLSF